MSELTEKARALAEARGAEKLAVITLVPALCDENDALRRHLDGMREATVGIQAENDAQAARIRELEAELQHPEYKARLLVAIQSEPETVVELLEKRDECKELREMLVELADAFQRVYESVYSPAPAGENGTYSAVRALLARSGGVTDHEEGT